VDPNTKVVVPFTPAVADKVRHQIAEAKTLGSPGFEVQVVATLDYALRNGHTGQLEQQLKSYTFCPVSLFRMVISPPGRIVCCPYFRGSQHHTIGTLDEPLDGDWLRRRLNTLCRINPQLECRFQCNRHLFNEALHDWRLRCECGDDVLAQLPVVKHSNPYWL